VFEQFFKLSLEPPSTYADVGGILEKLKEKKVCFERSLKSELSNAFAFFWKPQADLFSF
jgi:hypothetical protein